MTCWGLLWRNLEAIGKEEGGKWWRGTKKLKEGPSKYCISVSVSGLDWTFDVVYRVDQREEINTNVSAVWPSVQSSVHPPFFSCYLVFFFCTWAVCLPKDLVFTNTSTWLDDRIPFSYLVICLPAFLIVFSVIWLAVWIVSTKISNHVSLKSYWSRHWTRRRVHPERVCSRLQNPGRMCKCQTEMYLYNQYNWQVNKVGLSMIQDKNINTFLMDVYEHLIWYISFYGPRLMFGKVVMRKDTQKKFFILNQEESRNSKVRILSLKRKFYN